MTLETKLKISIDAMGGDQSTDVTVPASVELLRENKDLGLVLVGYEQQIAAAIQQAGASLEEFDNRLVIFPAEEHIEMDELPTVAFRKKNKSSMHLALKLLKNEKVDACVSAGNTGALMTISKFFIRTLSGVDRPAICTALPSSTGVTQALDLGANIGCTPQNLCEFAIMGAVLAEYVDGKTFPKVGLLNIGAEENKGLERTKVASNRLEKTQLNYVGFVEGGAFYSGEVDVIVCDGAEGNIALKTSEGVAKMIATKMKDAFNQSWFTKLIAFISLPVLQKLKKEMDPRNYNGASLLGLKKVVIKSHGSADKVSFKNAIKVAMLEIEQQVPSRIEKVLRTQLGEVV